MNTKKIIKIVIVEDDLYFQKALTKYVQTICNPAIYPHLDFHIKSYSNAHECIEELENDTNIMILDYFLINEEEADVLTGADIVIEANKYCTDCKIIMISAQQNKNVTTQLMQQGIYEYVDKNINSNNRIGAILQKILKDESELIEIKNLEE